MNAVQALVLARCAGFVFRAPGFSHPAVPPVVRAGLAFALSGACARGLGPRAVAAGGFVFALASEAALGAALGTAAAMLYDGAYAGGRALDDYVGIRASVPNANVAAGAGFGRLWSLAFAAAFFALGGYRIALAEFAHTFSALPPGALVASAHWQTFALALPATLLRAALLVAGPALGVAFVAQAALAAVSRIAPRLSTFALAFPVVFALALAATFATLPAAFAGAARPWLDAWLLLER